MDLNTKQSNCNQNEIPTLPLTNSNTNNDNVNETKGNGKSNSSVKSEEKAPVDTKLSADPDKKLLPNVIDKILVNKITGLSSFQRWSLFVHFSTCTLIKTDAYIYIYILKLHKNILRGVIKNKPTFQAWLKIFGILCRVNRAKIFAKWWGRCLVITHFTSTTRNISRISSPPSTIDW